MRGQIKFVDGKKVYTLNGRDVSQEQFEKMIPNKPIDYSKGECPRTFPDFGDWSGENGGRGRYCPQKAQKSRDPNGYCRSKNDLISWAESRGKIVEKD